MQSPHHLPARLVTHMAAGIALFIAAAAAPAFAQTSAAEAEAYQAQSAKCQALAEAGNYAALGECATKLRAMANTLHPQAVDELAVDPTMQDMVEAEAQRRAAQADQQAADREAREAAYARKQAARACTSLSSDFQPVGDGQREWRFDYRSTCAEPVTVHLCVVDGPDQPSQRRQARLSPGASQQWTMLLSDRYESPQVVHDVCFDPANCEAAGPRNCAG